MFYHPLCREDSTKLKIRSLTKSIYICECKECDYYRSIPKSDIKLIKRIGIALLDFLGV